MATTTSKGTIAQLAFTIPEGSDYQEVVERLNRLAKDAPDSWRVSHLAVRDPQFGSEMIKTVLTGATN